MKNLFFYCLALIFLSCGNTAYDDLSTDEPAAESPSPELLQEQFRVRNIELEGELAEVHNFLHDDLTILEIDLLSDKKKVHIGLESYENGVRNPYRWIINEDIKPNTPQTLKLFIWANTISIDENKSQVNFKAEAFFKEATSGKSGTKKSFYINEEESRASCVGGHRVTHTYSTDDGVVLWSFAKAQSSAECKTGKIIPRNANKDGLSLTVRMSFMDDNK